MLLRSFHAGVAKIAAAIAYILFFAPSAACVNTPLGFSTEWTTLPEKIESLRMQKTRRVEEQEQQEEEDSVYARGYLRATGCASYTISLDEDSQIEYQQNLGISVVGQETFLFFEYTIPYNASESIATDDDANDDGENGKNLRNLEENDGESSESSNYYYGSNAILAKEWLVAFSDGAITSGCVELEDGIGVFRDVVPGFADGRLSFSALYYGPICASDSSVGSSEGNSTTVFEMGIFLDSSCNIYVPGLSQILNDVILSDWTTGISFRGKNTGHQDQDHEAIDESYNQYNGVHGDLHYLDSYETLMYQLNYFHHRDITSCGNDSQLCQDVTEASVNLNTCEFLASEIWKVRNGDYEYSDNENVSEESALDYGEFSPTEISSNSNGESSKEYHYRMFQNVIDNYSYCVAITYDDDDCTGWSYGWGNYDCLVGHDDGTNNYYDSDSDCQQGVCYGILESSEKGYSVRKWLESNEEILEYEMTHIYKVNRPSIKFWYRLLVMCVIMVALLLALAFWTEGILRTFFQTKRSRKMSQTKKESFLDKPTDGSNSSTGTADSSLDTPSNSPERLANRHTKTVMLELTPTMSNLSILQECEEGDRDYWAFSREVSSFNSIVDAGHV